MKEVIDDWRFDRPLVFWGGLAVLLIALTMLFFLEIPETPTTRLLGISNGQDRVRSVFRGIYWSSRALLNRAGTEQPARIYGNVEGIDPAGNLIVTVAQGDKWVERRYGVADTQILDLHGAARLVAEYRTKAARLDVYSHQQQAVVWYAGVPLNVAMIEAGIARPDPNPPTNIVDLAFATYYWAVARGTRLD